MARMGNTSASSLLRSSASLSNAIADYNDKMKAYEWENSAKTDAEYQAYSKYLNDRITKLDGVGTVDAASKSLTVRSIARSASRSYVSKTIQRSSIAIMEGGMSSTGKLNLIRDLYYRAVEAGDDNSAQSLRAQFDSLSQQIQYEQATAASMAQSLAEKNAAAIEKGYANYINQIETTVKSLNNILAEGGQDLTTNQLKEFAKKLGVKDTAPTAGSLVEGAINLTKQAYAEAAMVARANGDEQGFRSYADKIDAIDGNFSTVGGFTQLQAANWAKNPGAIIMVYDKEGPIGYKKDGTPKVGSMYKPIDAAVESYTFDATGAIVPVYSKIMGDGGKSYVNKDLVDNKENVKDNTIKELESLGLTVEVSDNGSIIAMTSDKPEAQLIRDMQAKYGIENGTQLRVSKVGSGYQFHITQDTIPEQLLYLTKDSAGKFGLFKQEFDVATNGMRFNQIGTSDATFNPFETDIANTPELDSVKTALAKAFENYSSLPQGYTEDKIIPSIAGSYFSGNKALAADAVYKFRQQFEQKAIQTSNQQVTNKIQSISAPSLPKLSSVATAGQLKMPITSPISNRPPMSSGDIYYNQVVKNQLGTYFKDFTSKPDFYTEQSILPDVAKKFYGGDVSKASEYVYKYRKENFGS